MYFANICEFTVEYYLDTISKFDYGYNTRSYSSQVPFDLRYGRRVATTSAHINKSEEVLEYTFDHTSGGKVDICDSGHVSPDLSLADHDEMNGMPTTTELNKSSVQLEPEVDLRADTVVEGMDTRETVSVNDQRVAYLSSNADAKLELIVKDSNGGNLTGRQPSKGRTATTSDAPLNSSNGISQSPLVLSSAMKGTSMNLRVLCCDYTSISPFEKTKDIAQFSEDKPTVYDSVIVKLTCANKGISSFKLLFEYYHS
ncbi:unnamed protein product [Trichobilharzia regenti]|nr:unnamed protein product [Trichobilharzia regenti]